MRCFRCKPECLRTRERQTRNRAQKKKRPSTASAGPPAVAGASRPRSRKSNPEATLPITCEPACSNSASAASTAFIRTARFSSSPLRNLCSTLTSASQSSCWSTAWWFQQTPAPASWTPSRSATANPAKSSSRPPARRTAVTAHSVSRSASSARHCNLRYEEPEPRLFSFNNPYGACPRCQGFGNTIDFDLDLVIPDKSKSLNEGAIEPWTKPKYRPLFTDLKRFAKQAGIPLDVPWADLDREQRRHGD